MNIVPDTSAIIDGRVSEGVASGEFAGVTVVVPEAVVAELESQANNGRDTGWDGLTELQTLIDHDDANEITVEYVGRRPAASEKRGAAAGAVDALIREVAAEYDATLVTSDDVQAEVARSKGFAVQYIEPDTRDVDELAIEEFFDPQTMSLHLKVGVSPMAKRGAIGEMRYQTIADEPLTEDDLREYAADIDDAVRHSSDGFAELDEPGMTIVQFREFRIAVARPPFSDALEITAVRPIVKTSLEEYDYAGELKDRLRERDRGVLISGSPGAGKSTLAQAVAEFLADADKSVKTMEKPRDLQVGPEITQYTALDGRMNKTADSLLMVRPDYTIYDEVRKTDDFEVFSDMRLAGVGMIGVVHATRAIDALQRLIGRVELGLIPQVVDTVVYVDAGEIDIVYDVTTEVKVPEGLMEEDLARPVIVISDFETGRAEYEIYTFNRQVVTVPIGDEKQGQGGRESGVDRIAKDEIEREIRSIARGHVEVELHDANTAVVWVEEKDISTVIGKGGSRISDVEDRLGISIDVRTLADRASANGRGGAGGGGGQAGQTQPQAQTQPSGPTRTGGIAVAPNITDRHVVIPLDDHAGDTVEVRADGEYLFTATVSRGGEIQVSRGSAIAEELEGAIDSGRTVTVTPS